MSNKYIFDCSICKTKCDGVSKLNYQFNKDVAFSEKFEKRLINHINTTKYRACKTQSASYPDIEVFNQDSNDVDFYIEVKAQRRAFMAVSRKLPDSNLQPSETLALNLSDLLRYFDLMHKIKKKIFIFWRLTERPCILGDSREAYFYNNCVKLEQIYNKVTNTRTFRRQSGKGDIVNGVHKGVTVNYHFSLNELKLYNGLII